MGVAELILVALALSMDAFAVGLTNGMTDNKMKVDRVLLVAAFYGVFQFIMPLIGYFASGLFSELIEKIAPWVSFVLLAFIGGKMLFDGIKEFVKNRKEQKEPTHASALAENAEKAENKKNAEPANEKRKGETPTQTIGKPLSIKTLTLQAIATSIDALAVGVTFLALSTENTLCFNVWICSAIIGTITFSLSVGAVYLGKAIGDKLADKAQIAGGVVLVAIGLKILIEGLIG